MKRRTFIQAAAGAAIGAVLPWTEVGCGSEEVKGAAGPEYWLEVEVDMPTVGKQGKGFREVSFPGVLKVEARWKIEDGGQQWENAYCWELFFTEKERGKIHSAIVDITRGQPAIEELTCQFATGHEEILHYPPTVPFITIPRMKYPLKLSSVSWTEIEDVDIVMKERGDLS